MNKKFLLVAGLALATPIMATLPGCNGSNSGGPLGGVINSAFAGVSATGQVTDSAGAAVGVLSFLIANNGHMSGTLNSDLLATRQNLSTRAVINGTGQIGSNGHFTITFLARQGGQDITYTFTGVLERHNGAIVTQNLSYQASNNTSGTFNLAVTAPVPTATPTGGITPIPTVPGTGGGGTGTGSSNFTFSSNNSNTAGSGISGAAGVATRITLGTLNSLSLTFTSVTSATNLRTLTITLNKQGAFAVNDTFSLSDAADSANTGTVLYGEGVPTNKAWISTSGQAKITAITDNSVTVQLAQPPRMHPSALAGPGQTNQATGEFTLHGSGTLTFAG